MQNSWLHLWVNDKLQRDQVPPSRPPRSSTTSLTLFRALIDEIRRTGAEQGAILLLLHRSRDPRERSTEALPPNVHVCDVSEHFATTQALFADNLHWNDEGHRLAADCLAKWLADHHAHEASTSR